MTGTAGRLVVIDMQHVLAGPGAPGPCHVSPRPRTTTRTPGPRTSWTRTDR